MPILLVGLLLATAPAFGPFEAEDLEGRAVRVPDRLPGRVRLLLVAFERDRADALSLAFGRLEPLEREIAGLAVVQTPVIGKVNGVLQAVIVGAQRLSMPASRRPRYVPLFIDRKEAMAALGQKDPSACVAILVEGAEVRAVLPDACESDLPARARAALAAAGLAGPAPTSLPVPVPTVPPVPATSPLPAVP